MGEEARREPAYDVFISYKDSDREHHIERTDDSYDAHELYNALTAEGYKAFFSRVSLRDKVSEHYEPYIYNAIKTAKVMIVFGEKPEYFNAVWIKNKWMRFRKRIEAGEKHQNSLVVAYKGFDPADLPVGLRSRQCIDASSISFLEDLKKHINKIIRIPEKVAEAVKVDESAAPVEVAEKKKSKKGIIIAAIAAVLAICIGLGFIVSNLADGGGETTPVIPLDTEKTTFLPSVSETEAKTEKETPKDTETQVEVETPRETREVASADTEEATSAATQEPTGEPTVEVTDAPTEKDTDAPSEKVTENVSEETEEDYGLEYTLNDDGKSYSVAGIGECRATDIVIPKTYKGFPVTTISERAFEKCTDLTSVTIGNNVQTIGRYAFSYCEKVTEFVIPKSVRNIESGAFGDCYALKEVTIPYGVEVIGFHAFEYCLSLERVNIPSSVIEISSFVFDSCSALHSFYFDGTLAKWNAISKASNWNAYIGDHVIYCADDNIVIDVQDETGEKETDGEVDDNYGLEYALNKDGISYSVIGIGQCTATDIIIPEKYMGLPVTQIQSEAFEGCGNLTSVKIPTSIVKIGSSAFYGCDNLTSVHISDLSKWCNIDFSSAFGNPLNYAGNLYLNGKLITDLVIPDTVTKIKSNVFEYCTSITSVTIHSNVTSIGSSAFYGCSNLTTVYYSGSKQQWEDINIVTSNSPLTNATIVYDYNNK